jgi:hypothetical protein
VVFALCLFFPNSDSAGWQDEIKTERDGGKRQSQVKKNSRVHTQKKMVRQQ